MKKANTFQANFFCALSFDPRNEPAICTIPHLNLEIIIQLENGSRGPHGNHFCFSIFLSFPSKLCSQERTKNNEIEKYIKDFTQLVNKTHKERTILLTPFYGEGISSLDSIQLFTAFNEIDAFGF